MSDALNTVGRIIDDDTRVRLPHIFIAYLLKMSQMRGKIEPEPPTIDACVEDANIQESLRTVSRELRAHYPLYDDTTKTYGSFKRFYSSL